MYPSNLAVYSLFGYLSNSRHILITKLLALQAVFRNMYYIMVEVSKLSLGQFFALHEVLQYISVLRGSSLMWIIQHGGKLFIFSFTFLAKKSGIIHRFKWIRN